TLKRAADRVLALDSNIRMGREVGEIWRYVDELVRSGSTNEALRYMDEALKLDPWNLKYQIQAAEFLAARGDAAAAREKAGLVHDRAETDELIGRARARLGKDAIRRPDPLALPDPAVSTVILIPLGHTDHWLLWAMARSLGDTLGVPVSVQDACIELPAPTRDRLSRMQTGILTHMQTTLGDPEKAQPLQAMGIRREDIRSADDAVKALRATTLAGGGEAALKELDAVLEAARGADPQWHTDPLLATLQERTQAMKKPSVFYLGVAGVDVFMDRSNFAFGTALVGAGYGVMSYRRFTADFNVEPPDSARLLVRASKQALSSIGFMLGVGRCSSPTCARSYSRNLAEHDAKSARPCETCRRGIALALGKSEPSVVP
ncbi:MAG: hypothetical protein KJ579_11225, partial [Verrucomicrobia bacterium]|nr:hypothetical protein [Verrucomicrobiota bacterium]